MLHDGETHARLELAEAGLAGEIPFRIENEFTDIRAHIIGGQRPIPEPARTASR